MGSIFKAQEILKVAIQIEKNGLSFYEEVAGKTKYIPLQETFRFLASEEIKHRDRFQEMLDRIGDYTPAESYPGEYEEYLKALAGENIFTSAEDIKKLAIKTTSELEAVKIAIDFEKDSIIFYAEMNNFVPENDKEIVRQIIEEEKVHLRKLLELKNTLNKKS